jgi:hypothetical protein
VNSGWDDPPKLPDLTPINFFFWGFIRTVSNIPPLLATLKSSQHVSAAGEKLNGISSRKCEDVSPVSLTLLQALVALILNFISL